MICPVLSTDRLILRPHRAQDLAACASMWGNTEVVRFIGGKPSTEQETWFRILRYPGMWEFMGYGFWAIEEKGTGVFVGELGFQIVPPIGEVPEMGWLLMPDFHGRGYASEALRAAVEWGDAHLLSKRTVCIINPGNLPSIHLAGKFGFKKICETNLSGEPILMFERFSS